MTAAELLALASGLAFVIAGAGVGVRLIRLARRTHGLPERVMGLSLFLLAGVAWPLMLVVAAPGTPPPVLRVAIAVGSLAMGLGWAGVFVFTWRVFRPGAPWARLVAGIGIGAELGAGLAAVVRALGVADAGALRTPASAGLILLLGAQLVYAWSAFEAFRYRTLLRRRVPLGLADPLVADRFGLWGWTSVFAAGSIAPATWAVLTGGSPHTAPSQLVVGVCGLICSAVLTLAFLPPPAYVRFVRENAPAPLSGGGP